MVARVRIEAPTSRNLAQLDAAILRLEARTNRIEGRFDGFQIDLEHLGYRKRAHRLVAHEQQRLNGSGNIGRLHFPMLFHYVHCSSSDSVKTSSPLPSI